MVRKKTKYEILGMVVGLVVVTALGLMAGLSIFASLAISLIGVALGGWLAERMYGEPEITTEESAGRDTA